MAIQPDALLQVELAKDRCHQLIRWVDEHDVLTYPSNTPHILLRMCREAVTRQTDRLTTAVGDADSADYSAESDVLDSIYSTTAGVNTFLNGLQQVVLPEIAGAQVPVTLSTISQPLERLAKKLIPDCVLLLKTVEMLNYQSRLLGPDVKRFFSAGQCADLLEGFPPNLAVVHINPFPFNGPLTHALVGHELGHILYDHYQMKTSLSPYAEQWTTPSSKAQLNPSVTKRIDNQALAWFKEFTCDLFGLSLFGPAFFCAQYTFISTVFGPLIDSSTNEYPPARQRVQLLLDVLKGKLGASNYLDPQPPLITEAETYLSRFPPKELPLGERLILAAFLKAATQVLDSVLTIVGVHAYSVTQYQKDVRDLVPRLSQGIPANEYENDPPGGPVSFAGILNASWWYYTTHPALDCYGALSPIQERRDRFYATVSWALETAEFQRRWAELAERHNG